MEKNRKGKMFYFFVGCVCLSLIIVGATFAYFTASVKDENTVHGATKTTSFSLKVERVTTVDMAFGLIPMKNEQSPHAAEQMCYDDFNNAGCQIYKITLKADSDEIFFVDGYITTTTKDERIETRFARVYPKEVTDDNTNETKQVFTTNYTKEDLLNEDFDRDAYIKTGARVSSEDKQLNNSDDYNCLLVKNEQIGGDAGSIIDFYVMIWVYDNGTAQDFMQGMQQAYAGMVTFVTAQGNEIKASFD